MRTRVRLMSLSAPLAITLPVLAFEFDQVDNFFYSLEFRSFVVQLLTQLIAGLVNGFLQVFVGGLFGAG